MKSSVSKAGVALVAILGSAVGLGMMQMPNPSSAPTLQPSLQPQIQPASKPQGLPPIRSKKIKRTSSPTLIAIIDTGVDIEHPALKARIWVNQGESGPDSFGQPKESNGIDDDGNGYIDDVHGYDFTRSRDASEDEHGHGTHIAGIIDKAADGQNVQYMSLIYYRNGIDGESALKNSIEAVRYAIKMKADIINYSGGGNLPNQVERAVFEEANRHGILVVAAAGNEASNSEKQPFYPANYHLPNILSVTATDGRPDGILPSSNFGTRSVAVAAPGKDIRSTLPGGKFGVMTGTSQATAFVTGAAVRVLQSAKSIGEDPSPELIIEKLVAAGSVSIALKGKTRNSTHLDRQEMEDIRSVRTKAISSRSDFRSEFERALRQEISAGHGPL